MNDRKHWLVRRENIRRLWVVFILVLAAMVALNFPIPIEGHFEVDGYFGFFAGFGLATCVVMIVVAKALSVFLKRRDTYYDE